MSAARVLLLDDDEANRLTLGALLEDVGFTVLSAQSLAEARSHLKQVEIELCVLDRDLRGESGLDLIAELRTRARPPKVAVLTGSSEPLGVEVDLLLQKGGDSEEIVTRLARLV